MSKYIEGFEAEPGILAAAAIAEVLRRTLPGSHRIRTLPPGSVEISACPGGDASFSCSVVYPAATLGRLLERGADALRDKLHERCEACERRGVCRAA